MSGMTSTSYIGKIWEVTTGILGGGLDQIIHGFYGLENSLMPLQIQHVESVSYLEDHPRTCKW